MRSVLIAIGLAVLLALPGVPGRAAEPSAADAEYFEKQVRPLLVEKCGTCHGEMKPKGNLKLTGRAEILVGGDLGPAIVPGKPDESLLIKAVRYQGDLRMPPKGKLADKDIETLEKWVKLGAPWPGAKAGPAASDGRFTITEKHRQFWSFRPVSAPAVPRTNGADIRNEVDEFILDTLRAKGIAPAPPADKRTLIRRATFDLIGLPPTPAEIDEFLADDSPRAFAKVVERLLASPQYGERQGRHWLDVVRYADARDLIQLPPDSDFRESWRYRDWIVDSFNRDLPYSDFVRMQVAGDLLPAPRPGEINKDGLIATGLLAIADFVPGDVDKNQMIADYVNDQVDVVSRAFLGLSVACARCHDHKFDPISTEDYYSLAGIFFSTRIIPGPVAGNTPLVRVPLLSPEEITEQRARIAADAKRRAELERLVLDAAENAYRECLTSLLTSEAKVYLLAASECRGGSAPAAAAKKHGLDEGILKEWIALLDRIAKRPMAGDPASLRAAVAGKLSVNEAEEFQLSLVAQAKREAEAKASPESQGLARAAVLHFRADDPRLAVDADGKVKLWPNRAGYSGDAVPATPDISPMKITTKIGDHDKAVLRFDGKSVLEVPRTVPANGTLFVVYQPAATARAGERVVGWEDADVGAHGVGLMTSPNGPLHAVLRKNSQVGDLLDTRKLTGFETICLTWGPTGTSLRRNGYEHTRNGFDGVSSDPKITSLKIGGPGSGASPRFTGDIAELRVYSRPLTETERKQVESELRERWFQADDPNKPARDPMLDFHAELFSPRGPFWPSAAERTKRLAPDVQKKLAEMSAELEALRNKKPTANPLAVAVQDGGPPGTRHEGFKDSPVFIRGDHKRLGKVVPRGFPKVLASGETKIASGSGRLQLADWLVRPENPLTARVMVNRIWQHHFGEGLVRTPNDFGERGERPTHPELLDFLAARFVESGWSMKAMHRLIMNSATYQRGSGANAADPENRLFGHMNRRRLDAEAIRDSLLALSGKLDPARGGPAFTELATPRRTLYLMSARTGANTSDFGRLFDRADPSLIVAQRGQSIVAPQALFFLNDPFVAGIAKSLAARIAKESPALRIARLYALVLGRPPTKAELELGTKLLADGPDALERYCLLVLCTNEFLFID